MFAFVLCTLFLNCNRANAGTCNFEGNITPIETTSQLNAKVLDKKTNITNVETNLHWYIESNVHTTGDRNSKWDFKLTTDPCEFAFKSDQLSIVTFDIEGNCFDDGECYTFFGFQIGEKWLSVYIRLSSFGQWVYPPCKEPLKTGNLLSMLGTTDIRTSIAGNATYWDQITDAQNQFGTPHFTLANDPISNTTTLTISVTNATDDDASISETSCVWKSAFDSNTEIKYLQALGDANDSDTTHAFEITRVDVKCTNCTCSNRCDDETTNALTILEITAIVGSIYLGFVFAMGIILIDYMGRWIYFDPMEVDVGTGKESIAKIEKNIKVGSDNKRRARKALSRVQLRFEEMRSKSRDHSQLLKDMQRESIGLD